MEAPEKVYIDISLDSAWGISERSYENEVEYIRKDVVDNMLKTAEDHAYFACSEIMREKMIKKAVEWLEKEYAYNGSMAVINQELIEKFQKAMSDNY